MVSLKTLKMITELLRWLIVSFEVTFNHQGICLYSSMSFPRIFGALATRSTVTGVTSQKFICFACNTCTLYFSVSDITAFTLFNLSIYKRCRPKRLKCFNLFSKHKTKARYCTEITVANQNELNPRYALIIDRDSLNLQDLER